MNTNHNISSSHSISSHVKKVFFSLLTLVLSVLPIQAQQTTGQAFDVIDIYYDVFRQLDMNYADTLNYKQLMETSINAMLRQVDPYTVYFPKDKDTELKRMTTGKYGGVGSIIQLRDSVVIIEGPYEGKPAQKAGLLAGDVILSVDDFDARNQKVADVSDHLRGDPGTELTIRVLRNQKDTITCVLTRENIRLDAVGYSCLLPDNVGYISFLEFTEGSSNEFIDALMNLKKQGAERLIIDLRNNGGGLVDEASQILGCFLEKGTEIVSMRGKTERSNRTYRTKNTPLYLDMPLIVVVDRNSASASEIVAGALQDLNRAKLVGERTFGKGLVQNIRPITQDGYLKVTTAKYYLPSGRCIQAIDYSERQRGGKLEKDTAGGILPDIVLSDTNKIDICYSLYLKHMFFDYSVQYHREHPSIAQPDVFELSDDEIEDFCQFLQEHNFTYETETSKYFKDLLRIAKEEDLDDTLLQDLEQMQERLNPSFRDAILRHKQEVKDMLGAEIVERYYYQKGRAAFMLRSDKVLQRALQEF